MTRQESEIDIARHMLQVAYFRAIENIKRLDNNFTEAFYEENVLNPMLQDEEINGDEYYKRYFIDWDMSKPINLFNASTVSTAYFAQGCLALEAGKINDSLRAAVEAVYWSGIFQGVTGIDKVYATTKQVSRLEIPSKGGRKRADELYGKTIEKAYALARDKAPKPDGWRYINEAVKKIVDEVVAFSKNYKELSYANAEEKIAEWLSKMPDGEDYFVSVRRKKEKNLKTSRSLLREN